LVAVHVAVAVKDDDQVNESVDPSAHVEGLFPPPNFRRSFC
jgi:hypothetical protein